MHSRLSNVTVQMLLYLRVYVNLRLMNKLTSEMGNFFTNTMHDSNSQMVDPITYTPNEEPEENIVEIDETFSLVSPLSSHGRIFQYRIVVLLQLLAPNDTRLILILVVIDSPPESPRKED